MNRNIVGAVFKVLGTIFFVMTCFRVAAAQQTQYLAEVVDGASNTSTIYFAGLGAGPANISIEFFSWSGAPLILKTDHGTNSSFSLSIAANGESSIRTLGTSTLQVGWARINSSASIGVTEVFRMANASGEALYQTGVIAAESMNNAASIIVSDGMWKNTGIALANVNDISANLSLTLLDQTGAAVGTTTLNLPPLNQTSKYIDEIPAFSSIHKPFEGSLIVSSLSKFSMISVLFDGNQTSTVPVLQVTAETMPGTTNTVQVPAISDLILAGMPTGFTVRAYNSTNSPTTSVPTNSPTEAGLALTPGAKVQVTSVSGVVWTPLLNSYSCYPAGGPAGSASPAGTPNCYSGLLCSNPLVNGIQGVTALELGLVGVFLGPGIPESPAPPFLDFSGGLADLSVLQPLLKQPFYIGSGYTSGGKVRQFVVPDGATRLFLASLGCYGTTSTRTGSFSATLSIVP